MSDSLVLVLTAPGDKDIPFLSELHQMAATLVGDSAQNFAGATDDADIIFNWSGSLALLRDVFLIFSSSLAEFALATILYFAKDFRRMIRNQMAGRWEQFDVTMVSGQTLGIVGYGSIGRAIAARVRALEMKVLALRRHVSQQSQENPPIDQVYGCESLAEMLPECDYVAVSLPLTEQTRGLIGDAELAVMKKDAVLINVGRGRTVDERALIKALSENRIRGAGLDVFDQEPLPQGHPFYSMENVLLSPHCADHTHDWLDNASRFFLAQLERFRSGQRLLNVVNKRLGY